MALKKMHDINYDLKPLSYFGQDRREMIDFVPIASKRVLEIGCGRGEFMGQLRQKLQLHAIAIEPQHQSAEVARQHFNEVIEADVTAGLAQLADERFDCVILNDVLEHLADPWQTVASIYPLLSGGGTVVASIPNIRYFPVLRALALKGRWDYQDYGVLDRTHLRFFTQATIRELFEGAGFRVERSEGINPLTPGWKLRILFFAAGKRLADTRYQQIACVASRPS